MNETQYKSICEICDRILTSEGVSIERIATPWLHVIRPHPMFLRYYQSLFNGESTTARLKRSLRYSLSMLRHLALALCSKGNFWTSSSPLPPQLDVLIISHLLNERFTLQSGDFYYGELDNDLTKVGNSTIVALINYTTESAENLSKRWVKTVNPRVIFSRTLNFSAELSLIRRMRKHTKTLRNSLSSGTSGLENRAISRATQEMCSGGTLNALRLGEQVAELVAKLRPKAIIVTLEGHSWERVVFATARNIIPEIRCIGYQHAALFNLQHALQRPLGSLYDPDLILTSGANAKAKLNQNATLQRTPIEVLGSVRSLQASAITVNSKMNTCVVLPEGVESECHLLFEFSLACAILLPSLEFIWRLHPNMSHEVLVKRNSKLRNLPKNVTISNTSIEKDLEQSQWALYRGSTSILQAVAVGVRPVYLAQPGEISIDPLYEFKSLRCDVVNTKEFVNAIGSQDTETWLKLHKACMSFYTPLRTHILVNYLAQPKE